MSTPEPRNFINEDLSGQDLSGQSFADCHFEGTNLSGANLSGCDFTAASFVYVDLSGADLSGCEFGGSSFTNVHLIECNFSDANFSFDVHFTETPMIKCNLSNAWLDNCANLELVECRLSRTLFIYNIPLFTSCIWENTNYYFMYEDEIRPTNVPDNLTVVEFGNLMALDFSGLSHPSILDSLLDMWLVDLDLSVGLYSDKTRWPEGFNPNAYPLIKIDGDLRGRDLGEVNLENVSWTKTTIYDEYTKWPKDFDPSQHPNLVKIGPNTSLSGVDFTNIGIGLLRYQNFSGSNLSQANFSSIDLEEASFQGANLMGTNFSGAKLSQNHWCFEQAVCNIHTVWPDNFPESSKKHMIFVTSGAQIPDINLKAAILKDLDLSNVDLSNADLGGATFENIDLSGACLIDANIANTTFKNVSVTQTTILPRGMRFDNLPEGWVLKGPVPTPRTNHCFVVPDHIASIIAKLSDDDQSTLNNFIQELGATRYQYLVMMVQSDFDYKFRSDSRTQNLVLCRDALSRDLEKCRLLWEVCRRISHGWTPDPLLEVEGKLEQMYMLYKQGSSASILSSHISDLHSTLQSKISSYRKNEPWTITRRGDLDSTEYKAIHIDLDKLRANQQS